jgi:hypothetical protein
MRGGPDQAQIGQIRHASGDTRLCYSETLRQFADRKGSQPVERSQERILARLNRNVQAIEQALRVSLQLLADSL